MYEPITVKLLLEAAIDSLIDNFIAEPYLHRVEHSMHCELYSMLSVHRSLQGIYPIGNSLKKTGLIHKEWPEKIVRKEKKERRGNFDLAILNPENILKADIETFTSGRIEPDFAIEMGLNYNLDHLTNDAYKLKNSGIIKYGYLIHLLQPSKGITSSKLQELISWSSTPACNLASAVFDGDLVFRKRLTDNILIEVQKP